MSPVTYVVEPIELRERSEEQLDALFGDGFPAFITADAEVKRHIGAVREHFADLELVLLDRDRDRDRDGEELVAAAWGVPIAWTGEVADLPGGFTDAMRRSVEGHGSVRPDTFVVMAAQVHPDRRGQGVAAAALTALRELAGERGWARVLAPVRPTLKARYPTIPVDEFARWRRDDGTALDPWLRTHERIGARVVATAPASQTMTGTVAEWEGWTGLALPGSGRYVIPDGLALLEVDLEADLGTYVEPGVWMRHPDAC